jgi:hypothetical protein
MKYLYARIDARAARRGSRVLSTAAVTKRQFDKAAQLLREPYERRAAEFSARYDDYLNA